MDEVAFRKLLIKRWYLLNDSFEWRKSIYLLNTENVSDVCAISFRTSILFFFLYVLVSVIFVIVTGDYGLLEMIATGK